VAAASSCEVDVHVDTKLRTPAANSECQDSRRPQKGALIEF